MTRRTVRVGLHAKVFAIQVGIVVLVVVGVSAAFIQILQRLVEQQYGERVLGIAQTVALTPSIRDAFGEPDPSATIQPLAEAIRRESGVAFVVVSNRDRIRYSHPVPERIGQPLSEDDSPALAGRPYVVTERGTLGISIRAKAPIVRNGEVIGAVSVGILEAEVQDLLRSYWWQIGAVAAGALAAGALISFLLSSHIKRQIFGLEPEEIAALLEQREAVLHGIREGILAIDRQGTITLVNDEAARLLDLPADAAGRPVEELLPGSSLPGVVASGASERDQVTVAHSGRVIVVNRMPVFVRGQLIGAVATIRDQTEIQRLASELNGTRSYLDAMRAQAHEFANKLHTISGLIELGWGERAVSFIKATTEKQQRLVEDIPKRVGDPALAALLVGKASVAAERGVALEVSPETRVSAVSERSGDLVTIVGNLIENAMEATEGREAGRVWVKIIQGHGLVRIEVRDNGPGVASGDFQRIFDEGFTTRARGDRPRGLGLTIVRRCIARWGGEIHVANVASDGGAVFDVELPLDAAGTGGTTAHPLPLAR